jgi:hypothetical protein
VYEPVAVAVYVSAVAPLIADPSLYHWLPVAEDEVNTTLPPAQKVVGPPAPIVGVVGIGLTVTVVPALAALEHPSALVITTVYEPVAVAVYVSAVAPLIADPSLYHWLPVAEDEVNTTLPPAQKVVGPPALIVGVDGIGLTVTVVPPLAALEQPEAVTITV